MASVFRMCNSDTQNAIDAENFVLCLTVMHTFFLSMPAIFEEEVLALYENNYQSLKKRNFNTVLPLSGNYFIPICACSLSIFPGNVAFA